LDDLNQDFTKLLKSFLKKIGEEKYALACDSFSVDHIQMRDYYPYYWATIYAYQVLEDDLQRGTEHLVSVPAAVTQNHPKHVLLVSDALLFDEWNTLKLEFQGIEVKCKGLPAKEVHVVCPYITQKAMNELKEIFGSNLHLYYTKVIASVSELMTPANLKVLETITNIRPGQYPLILQYRSFIRNIVYILMRSNYSRIVECDDFGIGLANIKWPSKQAADLD
jgi:hypothetical protein